MKEASEEMKMQKNNTNMSSGAGSVGLLQVFFIALKLLNKISWSWWWVLSPIWGSFIVAFFVMLALILVLWVRGN